MEFVGNGSTGSFSPNTNRTRRIITAAARAPVNSPLKREKAPRSANPSMIQPPTKLMAVGSHDICVRFTPQFDRVGLKNLPSRLMITEVHVEPRLMAGCGRFDVPLAK